MKKLINTMILILVFISGGLFALSGTKFPLQLSHDIIIFKDLHGKTYAQVGSLRVAQLLKLTVGDYIQNSGETDRAIIQKAIHSIPGGGRILIKRGVYDTGTEGIKIPYRSHFFIEGEGFDPFPEELQKVYNDNWSYGGTCLVYRGDGDALSFDNPQRSEIGFAVLELKNIAFRVEESARSAIHLSLANYLIFENLGVATVKPSRFGIWLDGEGGATKFLKTIYIKGPFEVSLNLQTDHTLVIKTQIEDYTDCAVMLGKDSKLLAGVLKTSSRKARAGVSTYPVRCPEKYRGASPPLNSDAHWRDSFPSTVINTFDESLGVRRSYVPFLADGCNLVLIGCGRNPRQRTTHFYYAINGGKIFDQGQVLKEK